MIRNFLKAVLRYRGTLLTCLYATAGLVSLSVAYGMRFDFDIPPNYQDQLRRALLWVIPLKVLMLAVFGQFHSLLSYFSIPDLKRTAYACLLSSLVMFVCWVVSGGEWAPPRGVILADLVVFMALIAGSRLGFRLFRERFIIANRGSAGAAVLRRVGIIGAGDTGAALARELETKRGFGLQPAVFFDDNPDLWNSRVHNIVVVGRPEFLIDPRVDLRLDEVIIAIPSAPAARLREIISILQQAHLEFKTVPALHQLATGAVKVSQLRPVEVQDLLGREPIQLSFEDIRHFIAGRTVLVTGAGGSIGSEICRQVVALQPGKLLLVEQCEVQLFEIEQELLSGGAGPIIIPLIADVLDEVRMRSVFDRLRPDVVFHAAAHKHVPLMESQPSEAIKNNTFGTAVVARLAAEFEASNFVLISTDKAINPTNVMGATKRMAELFVQAFHAENPSRTKFVAVRFGNVLGSSGSVVPTFRKQIARGGPVKVTHPDVTRYFMTIPEAVGLVLQCSTLATGGEIFVLDMGTPIKIADLAKQMIELSGLRPGEDVAIEYTGLRPGEKLFEELQHHGEDYAPTAHPKIMRFITRAPKLETIEESFEAIAAHLNHGMPEDLKHLIAKTVPEYQPQGIGEARKDRMVVGSD